jgi:hypothetical protein
MDLMKEFETYLPEWARENNKPIPKIDSMNKVWGMAWESFLKEKLVPQWENIKQEFLDIELMTRKNIKKKQADIEILEEEESEEQLSGWEKVKKHLK